MRIELKSIVSLVQKIQWWIDDSSRDVISVTMFRDESQVHLDRVAFLSEFDSFQIRFIENEKPYYEMTRNMGAVKFIAVISFEDIVDLKSTMPNRWDYIQKSIQMESA